MEWFRLLSYKKSRRGRSTQTTESDMLSYDVVEWGKPLKKAERETPKPNGTEVLLTLKYCGVCHSDVHIREGYFELGGGKRLLMSDRGMTLPATLGHEPFGTVIAAGPEAADVPIGADRLVYPWTGCGICTRCLEGLDNYCMAPRMIGIQRRGGYDRQSQCRSCEEAPADRGRTDLRRNRLGGQYRHGKLCPRRATKRRPADPRRPVRRRDSTFVGSDHSACAHYPGITSR